MSGATSPRDLDAPWRITSSGLVLRVRLTPKASRDAVEGIEATADGPALKARVRALPENGAANAAAEGLIATWLHVPKSTVALIGGGKSRVKTLAISGDGRELAAAAAARLANAGAGREKS
jgi:uncharacterized protein YggU (UPF0235/DUF167 family)